MSRFILPYQSVYDLNGHPLDGALLYFYETGTNTPKDTYSDSTFATPNANPVVANSRGEFDDIFLNGAYRVELKDKNDVTQPNYPADGVPGQSGSIAETIAALKLIEGTSNQTIHVLSYAAPNFALAHPYDGGGGHFVWDATSTETDDGGTIIKATGVTTGRWIRIFSGAVNVEWFGATGDGTTDDATAIQDAFDSLTAGDTIEFTPLAYKVNTQIENSADNITVKAYGATLKAGANITSIFRSLSYSGVSVYGLSTDANGFTVSNGIRIESSSGGPLITIITVQDCTSNGGGGGIRILGAGKVKVLNNKVYDYTIAGILISIEGTVLIDDIIVTGNSVVNASAGTNTVGIYIVGTVQSGVSYAVSGAIIANNFVDTANYAGIRVERIRDSVVNDNIITNIDDASNGFAILVGINAFDISVDGNNVSDCSEGITFDTSDTLVTTPINTHFNSAQSNKVSDITRAGIRMNTPSMNSVQGNFVRKCQTGIFMSGNATGTYDPDNNTYKSGYDHAIIGNYAEWCDRAGIHVSSANVNKASITGNTVKHCNQDKITTGGGIYIAAGDFTLVSANICEDNYHSTTKRGDIVVATNIATNVQLLNNFGNYRYTGAFTDQSVDKIIIKGHQYDDIKPWFGSGQDVNNMKTAVLNAAVLYHAGVEAVYANPNGGDITLDATTPIAAGYDGQTLRLVNTHGTGNVIINTGGNVALGANLTIAPETSVEFAWADTQWIPVA